jgi:hypothetical protein
MAKVTKKKVDGLAISLKLLAKADRGAVSALKKLSATIMFPVKIPALEVCKFKVDKKKYKRRLTSEQCKAIRKAILENKPIPPVAAGLLGDLTNRIMDCIDALADQLSKAQLIKPGTLGCCSYSMGATPNLTQAQCNQYPGSKWDPANPDCAHCPP